MITLSREKFKIIYDSFVAKLYEDHKENFPDDEPNDQRVFGRGKHKGESYSANQLMLKNSNVKDYIIEYYKDKNFKDKINSRYVYSLKKSAYDVGKAEISIKEPYSTIIPLYLGYANFDAFFEEQSNENNWLSYTGYYYSMRRNVIDTYNLKFRFDSQDLEDHPFHAEFKVKEFGFHNYTSKPEYSGYAYILLGKLHLVMLSIDPKSKATIDRLKMVFDTGGNPEEKESMKGSILAVSATQANPILSVETIIIKDNHKNSKAEIYDELSDEEKIELDIEKEEEILNVKRYLNLHRNNFWVRPTPIDLEEILIKKSIPVDLISHLVGVYRVWRFDKDYNIVESKIIIEDDYKSTCYNNHFNHSHFKKQVCLIKVNKFLKSRNETICISTHPFKGTATLAYIILDMVSPLNWNEEDGKYLTGSISFVGQENINPMQSSIVFKWEGLEDTKNIECGNYTIDKIKTNKDMKKHKVQLDKLIELTQKYRFPKSISEYEF